MFYSLTTLRFRFPVRTLLFGILLSSLTGLTAQTREAATGPIPIRKQSFGLLFAYSPDSSHILMGDAEQRRLLEIGVSYTRRILANHTVNWQYHAELLPVSLESDPLTRSVTHQVEPVDKTYTSVVFPPVEHCKNPSIPYSYVFKGVTYSGTSTRVCSGRQWTIGEAFSPAGFQWNFQPSRKLQPFLVGHGGYMYSTKPIPTPDAGSFNFTFDLGAGVELFSNHRRSLRAEYRIHHISNHTTANANPGIDNGLFQLTYVLNR